VQELRREFPVDGLLKVAKLARSSFYYQLERLRLSDKHAGLKARICSIYQRHRGRYGYRRITAAIRREGTIVNHKVVQRLMVQLGLKSLIRPKKYHSFQGEIGRAAPNVLERKFVAARPNEKWVTDVTEFNVRGQRLYLSPILDLYNGEIVAFETARRPLFTMIGAMLRRAFALLGPNDKPILHSDQGWQYRMSVYHQALQQRDVTQSMSRRGNCLDNAVIESFFGTLKSEFYHLNKFRDLNQLQEGLRRYIHYYNHDRIKLTLGGLSPVEYRTGIKAT
jgi:transposase InsO family protein